MTNPDNNPIDLHSLMDSILSRPASDPAGKPVALTTVTPAHFPPIAASEKVITPLIADLVEHLLAYTHRQEVRIEAQIVSSENLPLPLRSADEGNGVDREGPWALLSISDQNAPFLPARERTRDDPVELELLEDFLVAARAGLQEQGGSLLWEPVEQDGTKVWIALPLDVERQDDADVSRVRETIETRLQGSDESNLKLLVQAENDELRATLAENLIEGGYFVVGVRRAGDVLPFARREMPDLIILDLQSRDPAAIDLALLLRGEPGFSEIPILFLTEITGPGIGRRMDTVDFLVQPEGASAILRTVDQVLRTGFRPVGRIMVVEQEDELREEMLGTIQAQGYPVVEARSAEEALALAERVSLGVVLANISLAEARDYWLVRQLRQLSDEIEIYLMTEGAQSMDTAQVLRKGISGYGDTGRLRELLTRVEDDQNDGEAGR